MEEKRPNSSEPFITVCLHYFYPEPSRSFFGPRYFDILGPTVIRSGLFGDAQDIASVTIASDGIRIQFNEGDVFSTAQANRLRINCFGPVGPASTITIEALVGFRKPPVAEIRPGFLEIEFGSLEVIPGALLHIRWEL